MILSNFRIEILSICALLCAIGSKGLMRQRLNPPHVTCCSYLCNFLSGGEDFDDEIEGAEEAGMAVVKNHPALLSKGFALSHPPTIHHALDGVIPFR